MVEKLINGSLGWYLPYYGLNTKLPQLTMGEFAIIFK
jgi:hypothetical protein